MRWCCGGGSGTSSVNINNNCQKSVNKSISSLKETQTSTAMITELSYKSGKNLTKLSKIKNGRDNTKCKNNNSGNEKHCVLKQHQNNQNVQISELENRETGSINETTQRGVLKSSLKLLRNKTGNHQRTKGVQYADEVTLRDDTINKNRDAEKDERIRLLQNEENENVTQLLSKKGNEEIELGGTNQFHNDIPFQIDNYSPTKHSHFSNSIFSNFKQNNLQNSHLYNCHFQHFDKYGPMLVRTCKTVSNFFYF